MRLNDDPIGYRQARIYDAAQDVPSYVLLVLIGLCSIEDGRHTEQLESSFFYVQAPGVRHQTNLFRERNPRVTKTI
jgi:hypothetical protein